MNNLQCPFCLITFKKYQKSVDNISLAHTCYDRPPMRMKKRFVKLASSSVMMVNQPFFGMLNDGNESKVKCQVCEVCFTHLLFFCAEAIIENILLWQLINMGSKASLNHRWSFLLLWEKIFWWNFFQIFSYIF